MFLLSSVALYEMQRVGEQRANISDSRVRAAKMLLQVLNERMLLSQHVGVIVLFGIFSFYLDYTVLLPFIM